MLAWSENTTSYAGGDYNYNFFPLWDWSVYGMFS